MSAFDSMQLFMFFWFLTIEAVKNLYLFYDISDDIFRLDCINFILSIQIHEVHIHSKKSYSYSE